jgi:cell division protein FtsB
MTGRQVLALAVVAGGVAFGSMGGEYSTPDWWTLRRTLESEQAAVQQLKIETDSLSKAARALETDSAAQEKAARESFGMLRPGELLYRIEPGKP